MDAHTRFLQGMNAAVVPWLTDQSPVTVRIEYGGMRVERDTTRDMAAATLSEMSTEHGIDPETWRVREDGTAVGKVTLTGQRAVATLIVNR